jgi:hypothetical protein
LFYPTLCFIVVGANSCSQQLVCDSSALVSSKPFFCLSFFFLFFRLSRVAWFSLTFSSPCWSPDSAFFQRLLVIVLCKQKMCLRGRPCLLTVYMIFV